MSELKTAQNAKMKKTYLLFCFLILLSLAPGIAKGQTALSIDQNETNFEFTNEKFHGWVRAVKQRFYTVAPKKYNDGMRKESKEPIYRINIFYNKAGNAERVEGPGFTTTTNKYNQYGDLVTSDKIGDYDQKYYRRVTDYVYGNNRSMIESLESNIPYTLSGGKAVYNFRNPDVRTKTEYKYNSSGEMSEFIVYEKQAKLEIVYKEQCFYDKFVGLTQKIGTNREGSVSMKEDYIQGVRSKTEFIDNGKINKRIIYDKKGRPIEETGYGYGDAIISIMFKYDDRGKLIEWAAYDALGNLKQSYTGISGAPYCVKGTFQYDVQGNRIGWTFYNEQGVIADRYFIQCTYDKRGNWTRKAMIENILGIDKFVIIERELVYY